MWLHFSLLLLFSFILMNLPHYGYFQSSHSTTCNSQCPIDGGWTAYGEWSEWSQCSNSRFCAGSVKKRTRSRRCTKPSPLYGGKDCFGSQVEVETKHCDFMECADYCVCVGWGGGPHYHTPDGAVIHLHENCKYTLWKSTADEQCAFKVETKNERRHGYSQLSYTRMIDFHMGRTKIRILPNGKTLIDDIPVSIPATTSNNTIEISRIGYFVTIDHLKCGIRVQFDLIHSVYVTVSKNRFRGNLTGLCGNCNGKADDDYRTKSGKIGTFLDIGNSYKVFDDSDKPNLKCNDDLEVSQININHFKLNYCVCVGWGGGPHYNTPDGAVLHFHENCKYTLWKSTADEQCAFKVETKNERRHGYSHFSYTRMIDFYMGRTKIRILPNGKTLINGTPVNIPATTSNYSIEIAKIGNFVTIDHLECSLRAQFDGFHQVNVIVSKNRFSGNLTGLCGNCNGKADDDYRTQSEKIGKFVDIGNSYKVLDDSDKPDLKCNDDLTTKHEFKF